MLPFYNTATEPGPGAAASNDVEEASAPPAKKVKKAAVEPELIPPTLPKKGKKAAVEPKSSATGSDSSTIKTEIPAEPAAAAATGVNDKAEPASSGGPSATAAPIAAASAGPRLFKPNPLIPDASAYTVTGDYTVVLNQTNITNTAQGNNKFYKLQVVEGKGNYCVLTHYGRTGEAGLIAFKEDFADSAAAIKEFEKTFKSKTKNSWANRANFVKFPDFYELVEIEAGDGDAGAALGKLSVSQIEKGQKVLKEIRAALEGNKTHDSGKSGAFYSLIPTSSGRAKPPLIDGMEILQEKENLLEFWLRMGFEDVKDSSGGNPILGVTDIPLPSNLIAAATGISDKYSNF